MGPGGELPRVKIINIRVQSMIVRDGNLNFRDRAGMAMVNAEDRRAGPGWLG
jgi:hypothetical protein